MSETQETHSPTKLGHFIQTYSGFLSSFVIGVAGLVATSLYQCNQSELARRQADSQQRIAQTQADNSWRIERAKILSENLQVLTAQGSGNIEQRYGVLLSLTRGNILDPELAVSYALELGRESPEFMRSVLSNTQDKDYRRLLVAFITTCEQRYGVASAVEACKGDARAARSQALAELVDDETDAALLSDRTGPLALLRDEREVQAGLTQARILWFFTPFLHDMYERRQFDMLAKFAAVSAGARLVEALVLLGTRNGEYSTSTEAAQVTRFHDENRRWVDAYLTGRSCDTECKARSAGFMLTRLGDSQGNLEEPLKGLLGRPRADAATPLSRLGTRLLLCQASEPAEVALRDRVLVPLLLERLPAPRDDAGTLDDLIGLVALAPDPAAPASGTDPKALAAWQSVLAALQKTGRYQILLDRRAVARRSRANPTPAMKKSSFCNRPGENSSTNLDTEE